jgi:hypothetical protein
MGNHTSPLRKGGLFCRPRTAVAAAATTALTLVSLGTSAPATSAADSACPAAIPVSEVAAAAAAPGGMSVTGLTVSQGTTPEAFSGKVLGVLEDGIGPDFDMILARLTSPAIDEAEGIWQGMSGSPVYAPDGRLIGAVSYGLSFGSSPVAGITPAAEMQELLTATPAGTTARTAPRVAQQNDEVAVPGKLQARMIASGGTSAGEADSGLSRLPLPLGVSGMVTAKRLKQVTKALDIDNVRVYTAGGVSAAAAADATAGEIVAGGNLAASLSYGDLSAIGVGTATAVCGDEVIAFGHPMNFSGPSTLSMHGASAIYVQEERVGAPFKVANPTAPVGSIIQDRMAGLLGVTGVIPETADVTSFVEVPNEKSRTGTTKISVPSVVPDIAAFHLLADQDRIFDGISGGRAAVGWTVTGERANGKSFTFSRSDRFANSFDISFEPVFDLADQLFQLQNNPFEKVKITNVSTRSVMRRDFQSYSLKKVQVRVSGTWKKLSQNRVLRLKAGTTKRFRMTLTSAELGPRTIKLAIPVPRKAAGKGGFLEIAGGNSFFGGEEGIEGGNSADSLDQLIRKLARAPRNDEILGNLFFFTRSSTMKRSDRKQAGAVVDGGFSVEVFAVPTHRRRAK